MNKTNRDIALEKVNKSIEEKDLGLLDNKYTFSKKILDIDDQTSLNQTNLSVSKLVRGERQWVLSRLKKLELVNEVLTDDSEKKRAKAYLLSSVLNMGIVSRTDDAWLIRELISLEKEMIDTNQANNSQGVLTDDELSKEIQGK